MSHQDRRISLLGEQQYGLVSLSQLLEGGLSREAVRRLVRSGQLTEGLPRVYRMRGAPESARQRLTAGVLAIPGAVASHRAAAALHGFADIKLRELEVTLRSGKRRRCVPGFIIHRTIYLPDIDVGEVAGIPVTSPARTLLDLAGVVSPHVARRATIDAINRSLVSEAELHDQIRRTGRSGRPGSAAFRAIVGELDVSGGMSESDLEDACYELLVDAGYPQPRRQHLVHKGGAMIGRVDLAYPDLTLAIEADSWEFHGPRWHFVPDRQRCNSLVAAGWRVMFFTYEDSVRPRRFLTDFEHVWRLLT